MPPINTQMYASSNLHLPSSCCGHPRRYQLKSIGACGRGETSDAGEAGIQAVQCVVSKNFNKQNVLKVALSISRSPSQTKARPSHQGSPCGRSTEVKRLVGGHLGLLV